MKIEAEAADLRTKKRPYGPEMVMRSPGLSC